MGLHNLGSAILGIVMGEIGFSEGNHQVTMLIGEVYSPLTDEHFQIYTYESHKFDGDGDGYFTETIYDNPFVYIENLGTSESVFQ